MVTTQIREFGELLDFMAKPLVPLGGSQHRVA
jgi:hypothetical protein